MIRLRYGNTNTFFIRGEKGGLLIDTDYAGTLPAFYKAIKANDSKVGDIGFILATHWHPDHMGLVSELMKQGVRLLLPDVQKEYVHFSDNIFARDGLQYEPVDETLATVISCEDSRKALARMGISGEIIHTPSHSKDSISLILDDGECLVGDIEPYGNIEAYEDKAKLKADWELILSFDPKKVYFAHRPEWNREDLE